MLRAGVPGEIYNIGGSTDLTTTALTSLLLAEVGADWDAVTFVPDRTANDIRYAMEWTKIAELGFQPTRRVADSLAGTVDWYRDHPGRWAPEPGPDPAGRVMEVTSA
ncbi:hypothetical protein [Amycolatopsis samaneae]|uniref:dTDP-glucose 4,6-dehydratase n=1 Tax=Amycolatopsis samaneae TaxID=664691 RepID=A0ABW5GXA4_9PSEU